jgi:hypothetical protein
MNRGRWTFLSFLVRAVDVNEGTACTESERLLENEYMAGP